jgi:amino acid transporter
MITTNSNEGLKRVIGVPGLTLSIISGIIGAGIFALPAIVSTALGTFAVFAYIVCGVLLASILFCYAEIGSRVTTSGGSYAYVEAAFGNLPGYIVNWLYFFGWGILGSAALMNIIADSLALLFPVFAQEVVRSVLFFLVTVFMILINVIGAKQTIGVVKIVTIIKMLPLFGIVVFGFSYVKAANLHWEHLPSFKTFSDTTLVLFFAFAGFEVSLGASGEIKNPKRSVPLSICIAGIVVLAVYLLLQTVAQGVLGSDMSLFRSAPLAAVADKIVGPVGGTILLLCAVLSCFGNVTLDVLCTPRFLFAGKTIDYFRNFLARFILSSTRHTWLLLLTAH